MITLLLILASLRTLHGSPVPALTSLAVNNLVSRDVTIKSDDATTRSTYDLVKSCVLTVLACVWTSAHPNIPGPRDSMWACFKRRLLMMVCALVAPELMVMWAFRQRVAARKIADDYNCEVLGLPKNEILTFWQYLLKWLKMLWPSARNSWREVFIELPKERARRGQGQVWTTTHGFFIQMGGFLLYEGDYPKGMLEYDDMKYLIQKKEIDAPIFTEYDLQDRSKGDAISKAIVVFQTTWFVIQCFTRLCKGLPLSELEVATLGFALLNAIIYAVWWDKPQGVGLAIFIPMKVKAGQPESSDNLQNTHLENSRRIHEESMNTQNLSAEIRPLIPTEDPVEQPTVKEGWLRRGLKQELEADPWPVHFIFSTIPFRFLAFLLRSLVKMIVSVEMTDSLTRGVTEGAHRVPMFYADSRGNELTTAYRISMIGIGFGAVHLLAWRSAFPSRTELLLWRISTLIIITEPTLLLMMGVLANHNYTRLGKALLNVIKKIARYGGPWYMFARFTIIILAFFSLHTLPPSAFITIPWTSFIPHF